MIRKADAAADAGPPIFTDVNGRRWSIGSVVIVTWWVRVPGGGAEEVSDEAEVVGLLDGATDWDVHVTFGPLLDLARPLVFRPGQVQARP